MHVQHSSHRHSVSLKVKGPRHSWRGSLILAFTFVTAVFGRQFGPERTVGVQISTSYFDILRQHSDRFAISSFASTSIGTITLANSSDVLTISIRRDRTHTAFENHPAQWRTYLATNVGSLESDWTGSVGPVLVSAGIRLTSRSGSLQGSPHLILSTGLFDSSVVMSAGIRRHRDEIQNEFFLQDYFAHFDESLNCWVWSFCSEFALSDDSHLVVRAARTIGQTPGRDGGYGMLLGMSEGSGGFELNWNFNGEIIVRGSGSYNETSSPVDLLSNNDLFSRLANKVFTRSYGTKIAFPAFGLPWEATAQYTSWNGRFVGHVETWPFTTLAASMFQNRLNIRGGGTLSMIDAGIASTITLGPGSLRIGLASYLVRSGLSVEHWEPEFFVFGVKNYRRDPLGISSAYVQKFEFSYGFSFAGLQWTAAVSQLIPVSVNYSTSAPSGPSGGGKPAATVRLDGGRRYSVGIGL